MSGTFGLGGRTFWGKVQCLRNIRSVMICAIHNSACADVDGHGRLVVEVTVGRSENVQQTRRYQ